MGLTRFSETRLKVQLERLPESITAPRTDAIYNCHSYLTKVPIAAIQPFIEAFTEPGEVVADFFAGSGMTGLAALSVTRRARLSDISVLGKHIATGYITDVSAERLRKAADTVFAKARAALGSVYTTKRATDGALVEMVRTVWSFTYQCPSCAFEMVYFRHLDGNGTVPKSCPTCGGGVARADRGPLQDVPGEGVVRGPAEQRE